MSTTGWLQASQFWHAAICLHCSLLPPTERARDGPLLSGTHTHGEHLAPGGRWPPPALTVQLLARIISSWQHLCYRVKPHSFATEMNSSTENAPQEGTTYGLCSCSSDTLRGREVLEANQPALSLQGERRQASETGKNLKGEWTSRTTTGASNNCIHLLVLATSHCLSLKKIAVFWIRKILQCKLSICYFSILLLAV